MWDSSTWPTLMAKRSLKLSASLEELVGILKVKGPPSSLPLPFFLLNIYLIHLIWLRQSRIDFK